MVCSRCGSSTPPRDGVCVVCGAPMAPATGRAPGQTPRPPTGPITGAITGPASGAATGPVSHPSEGETQLGMTPVPPASGSGGEGAGKTSGQGFLSPGHDFGSRYHIIRLLGAGGMGAVYQAWDRSSKWRWRSRSCGRRRPPTPGDTIAAERRFKRELLLARQVTHKNVVRIHDLGEIDGIKYITMPYVQGSDLASIIRREGRMPVDRVLAIAKQIGAGLAAAHEAGVVHRDLKPANIMIDADDSALIMDFGIARSAAGGMTMTVGRGRRHDRVHGARAGARRSRRSARGHLRVRADRERHAARPETKRREHGGRRADGAHPAGARVGAVDRSDDPGLARRARDPLSRAESRRAVRADQRGARGARGRRSRRPHDRDSRHRPDGRDVADCRSTCRRQPRGQERRAGSSWLRR